MQYVVQTIRATSIKSHYTGWLDLLEHIMKDQV